MPEFAVQPGTERLLIKPYSPLALTVIPHKTVRLTWLCSVKSLVFGKCPLNYRLVGIET